MSHAWRNLPTQDKVLLLITGVIGAFILITLGGVFMLTWTERPVGDVWTKLFDLVAILVGALAGYLAGAQVEKARERSRHEDPDETQ